MKKKKVLEIINQEFQEINENHKHINSGGCGIFAEFAYRSLSKVGLKPQLAVLTRRTEMDVKDVKKNLKNNASAYQVPFSHIVVVIGKKFIDSNGVQKNLSNTPFWNCVCVKGMDVELLKDWNKNKHNWNDVFNRNQIPSIKKKIKAIEPKLIELLAAA